MSIIMVNNRTFSLIKPSAVKNDYHGEIIYLITKAGFKLKAIRMVKLSIEDASRFYAMHKGKEFFDELIRFISSGPILALVLEKENAVEDFRKLIGATNPAKAEHGTIRQQFGESITKNAVHGADSSENAQKEWSFFFSEREILN